MVAPSAQQAEHEPASSPPRLAHVPLVEVPRVWPQVRDWFAAVCERPQCDLTLGGLLSDLLAVRAVLMLALDDDGSPTSGAVVQIQQHESGALRAWILAVGGRASGATWSRILGEIERIAAQGGCGSIEFVGRSGWARVLPGYVVTPCSEGAHFSKSLEA